MYDKASDAVLFAKRIQWLAVFQAAERKTLEQRLDQLTRRLTCKAANLIAVNAVFSILWYENSYSGQQCRGVE